MPVPLKDIRGELQKHISTPLLIDRIWGCLITLDGEIVLNRHEINDLDYSEMAQLARARGFS